jgi:hypothetical protein
MKCRALPTSGGALLATPFVARVHTSPTNFHPTKAMRLMKWKGNIWVPFGGVFEGA